MISIIRNKPFIKRLLLGILSAAFWLCVWQWACSSAGEEILIVSPVRVLNRLAQLVSQPDFWETVLLSLGRIAEGFLLGVLLGTALAFLTERSAVLSALFRPVLGIIKATPVASFIVLALVWMKSSLVPVLTAVLIVVPIVWANVSEGIRKIDAGLLQMAGLYGFGTAGTLRRVCIPSVLPYFTAACATAMGMAWKAGVAAEVLSSLPYSLGGQIYNAKIYLETGDLFAWTTVVIVLSVLLERVMMRAIRAAGKRYGLAAAEENHAD